MSQRVQVPAQQAIAVHYPGYVQNAEAAIDTMGGIRRISDAHFAGGSNFVQVTCRPGDELAHPILGERQPCNALLLRLSQPNARDSSAAAASGAAQSTVKVEIVARVAVGHRFSGMADFQYTSAPSSDLGGWPEVDGPFGPERSPMTILPPLFSRVDEPLDYNFKRQQPVPAPQPRKQAQQPAAPQTPRQSTTALPPGPQPGAQQPVAQPTPPQTQPQHQPQPPQPQQQNPPLQHQKPQTSEPS